MVGECGWGMAVLTASSTTTTYTRFSGKEYKSFPSTRWKLLFSFPPPSGWWVVDATTHASWSRLGQKLQRMALRKELFLSAILMLLPNLQVAFLGAHELALLAKARPQEVTWVVEQALDWQ